jgi:hypothetical protein
MEMFVNTSFLFRGSVRKAGTVLVVSETDLKEEKALGTHPEKKGRYISGLLNHCSPADDATAKFLGVDEIVEAEEGAKKNAVASKENTEKSDPRSKSWAEMDQMGAAYDKRWDDNKLAQELLKAKKARGM